MPSKKLALSLALGFHHETIQVPVNSEDATVPTPRTPRQTAVGVTYARPPLMRG